MASDRGTAPGGQPPPGRGKTILGMPRTPVLVGLVAVVAGVGYIWWRNRKASQAASSSATTGAAASSPGPCYDQAGNVVDCSDPSAVTGPNAATFQSEIQDLQGELAKAEAATAQEQTGQTEQETDVSQLTAEEQQLQKDIAALEKQERKDQQRPPVRRPPGRRRRRPRPGPGQRVPGGVDRPPLPGGVPVPGPHFSRRRV